MRNYESSIDRTAGSDRHAAQRFHLCAITEVYPFVIILHARDLTTMEARDYPIQLPKGCSPAIAALVLSNFCDAIMLRAELSQFSEQEPSSDMRLDRFLVADFQHASEDFGKNQNVIPKPWMGIAVKFRGRPDQIKSIGIACLLKIGWTIQECAESIDMIAAAIVGFHATGAADGIQRNGDPLTGAEVNGDLAARHGWTLGNHCFDAQHPSFIAACTTPPPPE